MTNLTAPRFTDPDKAREHLEALHWPEGPFCPKCGSVDAKRLPDQRGRPSKRNPEGALRKGLVQCNGCRQQFTVTVGTVFEDSKVPLNKWLLAVHLLCASKKGMSAHQLHRMLGVTYKTAWFMSHRIREAMRDGSPSPLGTDGGRVEVDETYIGRKAGDAGVKAPKASGSAHKNRVVALIDRSTGRARSMPANGLQRDEVAQIVRANVAKEAVLTTDESRLYSVVGKEYAGHDTILHGAGIYVRGDVTTNTVEGFFSIFKRGMRGVYQHCGENHLHRYTEEFAFRYSYRVATGVNDDQRADKALEGIAGKRLTYRRIGRLAA